MLKGAGVVGPAARPSSSASASSSSSPFSSSSSSSSAQPHQMEDAASPWWERSLEPSALSTLDSVSNQGRSWLEASAQKKFLNQVKPRSIDAITAITTQQAATFPSRSAEPRCLGRLEVYSRAFHALIESVPACQVRAPWRRGVCAPRAVYGVHVHVQCGVWSVQWPCGVRCAACGVRCALCAVCLVQYCVPCTVYCALLYALCFVRVVCTCSRRAICPNYHVILM